MKKLLVIFIFICFFFSGITLAKKNDSVIDPAKKLCYVNMAFWESFNDDYLLKYIELAVKNNPNARKASWTVEENRQMVKVAFARELPYLGVEASYLGLHVPQLDNFELSRNAFILPFNANWELDLLHKNRDKTRSAKKVYEASKDEEKGIYISLASSVGTTYFNILKYDKMIKLQENFVKNQYQLVKRAEQQYKYGVINATQKDDIKTAYEDAVTNLANLKSSKDSALYQLAVLIGDSPNNINCYKRSNIDKYFGITKIPPVLSSNVIFSRPDVLAVEKKLEAARIDVRVARKELLPSFNITGNWVFNTISPGAFFSWESSIAYLLASASQDIFAGGRKIAMVKAKKAKYKQMFEEYKNVDLTAVKEVNTALCYLKNDNEVLLSSKKILKNENANFLRTQNRYNAGTISAMNYFTEKNSLIKSEQNFINSQTINLIDYITLYKAVGGKLHE